MLSLAASLLLMSSADGEIPAIDSTPYLEKLVTAETRWRSAKIENYHYTFISGGAFGSSEYRVTVRNGKCLAYSKIRSSRTIHPWRVASCDDRTIAHYFMEIRRQLERGVERIDIAFDPQFGFVSRFSLDPAEGLTDQTWYGNVTSFKILKSRKQSAPNNLLDRSRPECHGFRDGRANH